MKLTYIYHSCFIIEGESFVLLIDYYRDTNGDTAKNKIFSNSGECYILSTHSHSDHFNAEIMQWGKQKEGVTYLFSSDILEVGKANTSDAFFMDKQSIYQDKNIQVEAFGSTDIGISFLIEAENKKIFHAGDLNNWHWNEESTAEESLEAENNYLTELEILARKHDLIDVVMFPIDPRLGKDYMLGGIQLLKKIKTNLFVPMHFGEKYTDALAFKTIADRYGARFMEINKEGESILF